MTIDFNQLPEHITVTDHNGVPDHVVQPLEVGDDAFALALAIGAANGDEDRITTAVADVLHKWDDKAGYVFASAITQFSRDLLPMMTNLTKTATGVDFAAHCEGLAGKDYNPYTVDTDERTPTQ